MKKIIPFLWFDRKSSEAAAFYTSIFKNSKIISSNGISSTVLIEDQELILFDGGPHYQPNPAFSLMVQVETQSELDEIWGKLSNDEGAERCGWLKDKFGFSWQIIPTSLGDLLGSSDRTKAQRALQAMLQMKKLDIEGLQRAYHGN